MLAPSTVSTISSRWAHLGLPSLTKEEHQEFEKYFKEQIVFSLKVTMPLTCLLQILMLVLDTHVFVDQNHIVYVYRLTTVIGCASLFVMTYYQQTLSIIVEISTAFWIFALISIVFTVNYLDDGIYFYMGGLILTILYICGFVRATFIRSTICCIIGFIVNNAGLFAMNKSYLAYVFTNLFLFYTAIIGLSLSYTIELLERKKFLLQRRLEREKARSDDLAAWMRQLATFLRHEVRQPIAQINSSIELTALRGPADTTFKTHLLDATNAAQQVWHLIDRASRATDAEAFVRESHHELVSLRDLVSPLVQGFAQTYSGVQFRLQAATDVNVCADPVLLKEAVSNLLTNAASFADEDTVVELSLQRHSDRAQITVRNQGPRIEGDTEILFQPFASSRSDGSSEHHGLGLYLVRLIAQQHGGTAMIGNTSDGEGVEASLFIPTSNTSAR